jgi:hypothetical protein
MRPNQGTRDPFLQAIYWRQSRTFEEVTSQIVRLRNGGAFFLAFCIETVGRRDGKHVTNAIPGYSWHQWGESVDCFWVVDGRAEWSVNRLVNGVNGYRVYAQHAASMGLTSGGFWQDLPDWPHVQLRAAASPGDIRTLSQINDAMQQRFG